MINVNKNTKWKVLKERYNTPNDQGLKFLKNLVSPSGVVVSLFCCTDDSNDVRIYDKMFRDYKKISSSLSLLLASKIKKDEKILNVYVIREKISKNAICHIFFDIKDKLYAVIVKLDNYFPSMKKIRENNKIIGEFLALLGDEE